jgi:uncharacterized membrane protein
MRWYALRTYLGSSLWFVPMVCVLIGVGLSFGTIALDHLSGGSTVPRSLSGDSDAALAILSTVAVAMVTLTGLVLTITMVVVQLAMGQFTPRVLRTILRDRPSQFAIGVFVATFAHAMLVMREVRSPTGGNREGVVPGLAIVVAYVLILVSIMVLVLYVHHIGRALRVAALIDSVGDDARDLLERLYPADVPEAPPPDLEPPQPGDPAQTVAAARHGVVVQIDVPALVDAAAEADAVIVMVPRIGDFVPEGATLFHVLDGSVDADALRRAVVLGNERTLNRDLAYGFRMLVDVAVRSLSPSMGDPTSATQALDRIHDLLRQLAVRPFPTGQHPDGAGVLRVVLPTLTWDGYVRLSVDEIRNYGGTSMQVLRRIEAMLHDLLEVAPPGRRPILEEELELIEGAVPAAFDDDADRRAATTPDQQGIGSGADLVRDQFAIVAGAATPRR